MREWNEKILGESGVEIEGEQEMMELGAAIGRELESGDVLALVGNLGAGKTHFVKGLLKGVGCRVEATSPTFGLVHEYAGGRVGVFHFDFYRLEQASDLEGIGWYDYLDADGVVVVEWADKFPELMPDWTIWLGIDVMNETRRKVCRVKG